MAEEKIEQLKYIKIIANEIYFYCDVSIESVAEFNTELRKLDIELRTSYLALGIDTKPTIKVYIHSPGGDLHAGLGAHDHIRKCKSHVVTIADGLTASAAAIMYLGGHKRLITRNAWILIHQMSSEVWGSFDEITSEVENLNKLMTQMTQMCRRRTDLSEEKLEQLMHKDILLSAKKCIKYGVAYEICASS